MSAGREDAPGSDGPPAAATGGGAWLTYRYRLGGEGTPEVTGTMKAPSCLSAARRILDRAIARGLGGTIGPAPAYLRLRAAGEQEVLLRVVRADAGADVGVGAGLRVEVVSGGAYPFVPPEPPAVPGASPRRRNKKAHAAAARPGAGPGVGGGSSFGLRRRNGSVVRLAGRA